jgi:hypothetical protein
MSLSQKFRVNVPVDLMPQGWGVPDIRSFSFNGVDYDREQKDVDG